MLPGMAGESVLAKIRETSEVPVIIISAKTDMDGKVLLLQTGADDYITKPFDMREVLARVELQLKRKGTTAKGQIEYQELHLDSENHLITINGTPLSFTRQEFAIMELLMKHPDKIYSKQELYELAWEECYIGEDKTLNVHISKVEIVYFVCVDGRSFAYTEQDVYKVNFTLAQLEELLKDISFYRCSKSMIMNIDRVANLKSLSSNRIDAVMQNGEHIMISRTYATEFRRILRGEH